ncbi:MAG: type II secretion system F family protein [Armatimonadota bacterium]
MANEEPGLSNRELAQFCRQFSSLCHAQINILDIFDSLKEQTHNPLLREIIESVRHDTEHGRSLATAFGRYPNCFSPFFISMVRQGELEGELDRIFEDLATHFASRIDDTPDVSERTAPAFDWERAITVFQWIFTWVVALIAVSAIGSGIVWYGTTELDLPGAPVPNILLFVGVVLLLGVILFARGRRRL